MRILSRFFARNWQKSIGTVLAKLANNWAEFFTPLETLETLFLGSNWRPYISYEILAPCDDAYSVEVFFKKSTKIDRYVSGEISQ